MKRIKQEAENKPQRKAIKYLRFGAVFLLAVLFLEIWSVNRLSTYGEKIQDIKSAKVILELENQVLENQIAQDASLTAIEVKASALGFNSVKTWHYFRPSNLASAY